MKMIKTTLALTGVLAAMAFAPEASAIPAFARQVGMACSACHYQHFPALNSFGRSFKESGYTMVGAQEKIEGEGVSLPVVLNAALVGYASYGKTNGTVAAGAAPGTKTSNDGSLQIPQQVSLFLGGRAGEHIGFEAEINVAGTTNAAGASVGGVGAPVAGVNRFKVPFTYDVSNVKAGMVLFSTGNGVADSFEVLNTGAVNVHTFNQNDQGAFSAQQYIGTNTNANGVAFIASNDDFFANFAKWGANAGAGGSGGPSSNYLRAAWTTSAIPGFDSAIGFQSWSGTSYEDTPTVNLATGTVDTKATAIDAQMLGDVSGMPLTLIASYARAPATAAGANPNLFNTNAMDKSSFNVAAELGLIPNKVTAQLAVRRAKSGVNAGTVGGTAGTNASDNAIVVGATYSLALNARFELTYSKYSGDMYGAAVQNANVGTYLGDNLVYLDFAFGF